MHIGSTLALAGPVMLAARGKVPFPLPKIAK